MKVTILKKLRNELVREVSGKTGLVEFKESRLGGKTVLVDDIVRAIDSLIYQDYTSVEREDGYEQLVDGEPITMQSNEVFEFKCCDCGLVHNMVIATEKQQEIGFVIERIEDDT